jgi:hypothetical protein
MQHEEVYQYLPLSRDAHQDDMLIKAWLQAYYIRRTCRDASLIIGYNEGSAVLFLDPISGM